MPIFEYDCQDCEKAVELLIRSAADERGAACPDCGSRRLTRRPSVFAAHGAAAVGKVLPHGGGCGRCGDPQGPCARE